MERNYRLSKLRLGDEIEVKITIRRTTDRKIYSGVIVHIFPKGTRAPTQDLVKFYKPENVERFKALHYTMASDRIVLECEDGEYYIFARSPKFFIEYNAEIRMIHPVIQRRVGK